MHPVAEVTRGPVGSAGLPPACPASSAGNTGSSLVLLAPATCLLGTLVSMGRGKGGVEREGRRRLTLGRGKDGSIRL